MGLFLSILFNEDLIQQMFTLYPFCATYSSWSWDMSVNNTDKNLCPHGANILMERRKTVNLVIRKLLNKWRKEKVEQVGVGAAWGSGWSAGFRLHTVDSRPD